MDGHEREDVVEYCNKVFLPKLVEYKKLMAEHIDEATGKSCLSWRWVSCALLLNFMMRAVFMQMMKLKICGYKPDSNLFTRRAEDD